MKPHIVAILFLFSFTSLFASAELTQTGFKFPDLQQVKPVPDYKNYDSECEHKRAENSQLYALSMSLYYPVVQNRIKQEGWVVLSYDIIQGKVGNINIIESSPDKSFPENTFESYAINDLKKAKIVGYEGDLHGCIASLQYRLRD